MLNAPKARHPKTIRNVHSFEFFIVGILVSSESEIEAQQNAIAAQVISIRRSPALPDPRVLVVEGESIPARHKGVIAIADDVVIDVPQIRRHHRKRLLRHSNPLRSLEEG